MFKKILANTKAFLDSYYFIGLLSAITLLCYFLDVTYIHYILVGVSLILVIGLGASARSLFSIFVLQMAASRMDGYHYKSGPFVIIVILLTIASILLIIDIIRHWKEYLNKIKRDYVFFSMMILLGVMLISLINTPVLGKSGFGIANYIESILYYLVVLFKLERTKENKDYIVFSALLLNIIIAIEVLYVFVTKVDNTAARDLICRKGLSIGWVHPNHMMAIVNIGLILSVYYFMTNMTIWKKIVASLAFFVAIVLNIITVSRGGYLGLIFASPLLVALVIYLYRKEIKLRKSDLYYIAGILSAILMFVIILSANGILIYILKHLDEMGADLNGRKEVWSVGFDSFKNHPLIGAGIHSAGYFLGKKGWILYNYHNHFLQMLAYCGILGFVAFILHLISIVKRTITRDIFNWFIFIIVIYAFAHGFVDTIFFNFRITPILGMLLALCVEKNEKP